MTLKQIDAEQLETILSLDQSSPGLLQQLVESFAEVVPKELHDLHEMFNKNDREKLALSAHRFKSSSINLGAYHLADALRDLENTAKEISLQDIQAHIKKIEVLSAQAVDELIEYAKGHPR
jgi:HPt (histidine-containing phosphotransfer) domain-containing protein